MLLEVLGVLKGIIYITPQNLRAYVAVQSTLPKGVRVIRIKEFVKVR